MAECRCGALGHKSTCAEAEDRRVVVCNIIEPTKTAKKGTLAYVQQPDTMGGDGSTRLLFRSRGGRWIEKWERTNRLGNFRAKTIPPEHPVYDRWLYDARWYWPQGEPANAKSGPSPG